MHFSLFIYYSNRLHVLNGFNYPSSGGSLLCMQQYLHTHTHIYNNLFKGTLYVKNWEGLNGERKERRGDENNSKFSFMKIRGC